VHARGADGVARSPGLSRGLKLLT